MTIQASMSLRFNGVIFGWTAYVSYAPTNKMFHRTEFRVPAGPDWKDAFKLALKNLGDRACMVEFVVVNGRALDPLVIDALLLEESHGNSQKHEGYTGEAVPAKHL